MLDAASELSVMYSNLYQGYLTTHFMHFKIHYSCAVKHKRNYLFCPKATTSY